MALINRLLPKNNHRLDNTTVYKYATRKVVEEFRDSQPAVCDSCADKVVNCHVVFAFLAGRGKGKQADKLPLIALQCLDALLRHGRTCEGVAELLREVPVAAEAGPSEASIGIFLGITFWE